MAIEVRVPTILRTYTDGAKVVEADPVIAVDLDENLPGRCRDSRGRGHVRPVTRRGFGDIARFGRANVRVVHRLQKVAASNVPDADNVP